ncbi:MAG: GMC family oxidoreductase [Gammaproteobacteria bacterium]
MIQDANDFADGHDLSADVCIIGAGAAGISMSLQLLDTGINVLMIESGGMSEEQDSQAHYAGTVVDERLHSPPDRYRQRRFGGTTTIWGGRCMPLDPIDFEERSYMPHSGWPVNRGALEPFYANANRLCEAGEFKYTSEESFDPPPRPMIEGFQGAHFTTNSLERFSCPTDFGARYGARLRSARNVRVILHANLTELHLNTAGGHLESATVRTVTERRFTVRARQFVLAAGGIEVARLLLASRDVQPQGIGNRHDVVGRYYMCHIAGTVGALSINRPLNAIWNGYDVSDEGIYCRRRIALTARAQRQFGIGNFVARLHHPRITDPAHHNAILSLLYLAKFLIPYEYGKRLHGEERAGVSNWLKHVRNVLGGPFDAAGFSWHMLRDRKLADRKFPSIIIKPKANLFSLDFHSEQQPNPHSRVRLGDQVDALGMQRIMIDWRYAQTDVDTVKRAIALFAADIEANELGRFDYDPSILEFEMTRYGAYGGHHIGTARMGTDPRSSVVDAECRVHGVDNLWIASAAVFPTSSQANPTLTVVALALRLAHRLRSQWSAE